MLKVQKNHYIDFHRNLPEKTKPKGIDILGVSTGQSKTAPRKMNKTASSASLKLSGFFSQKNQVSFKGKTSWVHKLGQKNGIKNFFTNDKTHNFFKKMNNLGIWETIAVFAMSVTVKPLSLLAVPGAKKEDKKYAATKAMLAGTVDFALTTTILSLISKKIKRIKSKVTKKPELLKSLAPELLKNKNGKEILNTKIFKRFKMITTYIPKILMIPVRAALTIALIPPTLKLLFPTEAQNLNPKKQNMRKYFAKKS